MNAPHRVRGNFHCCSNQLTSLAGSPLVVGGCFACDYNQLTSLQGAPQQVGGFFDCSHNTLTTLAGAPRSVGARFDCSHNHLIDLHGLEWSLVRGRVMVHGNPLVSLEGQPEGTPTVYGASRDVRAMTQALRSLAV